MEDIRKALIIACLHTAVDMKPNLWRNAVVCSCDGRGTQCHE